DMMADPSVVDQLTRLKLKLLEKAYFGKGLLMFSGMSSSGDDPLFPLHLEQTSGPAPKCPEAKEKSAAGAQDMVEMMLMQNAQMHQIMMQNMMLKALPPALLTQPGGAVAPVPQQVAHILTVQDPLQVHQSLCKTNKILLFFLSH
ncbi:hypothetical protein EK904_002390, partial [Melospiza melodia maxima]